jgi:hypothetical protein
MPVRITYWVSEEIPPVMTVVYGLGHTTREVAIQGQARQTRRAWATGGGRRNDE